MTFGKFALEQYEAGDSPSQAPSVYQGKALYSPVLLAALAVLGNLPVAVAFLGVNMRRRGRVVLGNIVVVVAALVGGAILLAVFRSPEPRNLSLFAFFGAVFIFALERRPFAVAVRRGAVRARWQLPWLCLLAYSVLVVLVAVLRLRGL